MTCLDPLNKHPCHSQKEKHCHLWLVSTLCLSVLFPGALCLANAEPHEQLNQKHLHGFWLSKADNTHCVSQNTCPLCNTLRTSPIGNALSTPNCVETTQKESPQNQNVLWIHGRERAGKTQPQPSTAPLRASLFLESYFRAVALAQHHRCTTNYKRILGKTIW